MALSAGAIGILSSVVGLRSAYIFDTPAGPSIVCVAALVFLVSSLIRSLTISK